VDNEIIQSLVDKFLNKGTLADNADAAKKQEAEKFNKEAQKLVNSSVYWDTQNLKVFLLLKEEVNNLIKFKK
jgi:hypothetical protein